MPTDPRGLRSDAPLLDAWLRFQEAAPTPFTIPGHKQRRDLVGDVVAGDVPLCLQPPARDHEVRHHARHGLKRGHDREPAWGHAGEGNRHAEAARSRLARLNKRAISGRRRGVAHPRSYGLMGQVVASGVLVQLRHRGHAQRA